MYKIMRGEAPRSLIDQVPRAAAQRNMYNIRDNTKLTIPKTTSQQNYMSFIPATIRSWNELKPETRNATSTEQFKEMITPLTQKPPTYFEIGDRKEQISHCRLRLGNANLNANLYSKNLADTPNCTCGQIEHTTHYLLQCQNYTEERRELMNKIQDLGHINKDLLLNGSDRLTADENNRLFLAMQNYIQQTKRFE